MVRFIFVCMGVVALAMLSIAGQFPTGGISSEQEQIAVRNDGASEGQIAAVETPVTAEDLNAIETAAGANVDADAPGNQTFGDAFSTDAPQALRDEAAAPEIMDTFPTEGASN